MSRNQSKKRRAVKKIKKGSIVIGVYKLREKNVYCGECSSRRNRSVVADYEVYRIDLPRRQWKGYCCVEHATLLAQEVISLESRSVVIEENGKGRKNLEEKIKDHKRSTALGWGKFTCVPNDLRYKAHLPRGAMV